MAFASGQLGEAERRFSQALEQARDDPGSQPLAALIANRLAGTYTLLGDGREGGGLRAAGAGERRAWTRRRPARPGTLIAIGAAQLSGPARRPWPSWPTWPPTRPGSARSTSTALSFRGMLRLVAGDLGRAVSDLTASLGLVRRGATLTLGLRAYFYLAWPSTWPGSGTTCCSPPSRGSRRRPSHPAGSSCRCCTWRRCACPPRAGAAEEAERHARLAEEAAASVDYGQERVYAAMARALVCQAAGDYLGMADALGAWQDDAALDGRSRLYAVLWRPLLAEGLVGSGQLDAAAAVLGQLRADSGQVAYLGPALAWLEGWLAEQRGDPEQARAIYQRGRGRRRHGGSPVYAARLLLAYGRLLRRTGQRRQAVERLRQASDLYQALRAAPFIARAEEELAACRLPGGTGGEAVGADADQPGDRGGPPGRARACPTRRSPPSCSSAARRWSTTWATSTPSAGCTAARSCGASSSNGASPPPSYRTEKPSWPSVPARRQSLYTASIRGRCLGKPGALVPGGDQGAAATF